MKKVLFIDRDGTLIYEPPVTFQVDRLEQLQFLPGVIRNLYRITRELDYELVMVSNQDGLGTPVYPEAAFRAVQDKMLQILEGEGISFSAVHIDRSFEQEGLCTRKPGTGMLTQYLCGRYDLAASYVIGDRNTDVMLARNLGAGCIFIRNNDTLQDDDGHVALEAGSWDAVGDFLVRTARRAIYERNTSETKISVRLNLDGAGSYSIDTGLGFLDHMLEQLARHSGMDLELVACGDLHVDEHHTIEDTALALGAALDKALGSKRGIERYGFCLPMDDALAQVAVDFGGRSWLVWDVAFRREFVGGVPTEMWYHFFKSFSDAARCNLNIRAEADNDHHRIEAVFKAFARAVKAAVRNDGHSRLLPTTKGLL